MIYSELIKDSSTPDGERLSTFVLTYPRMIHSEFMTHRAFSRNAASSRAIPISKMMEAVRNTPALPVFWGSNQPGMQAAEQLKGADLDNAELNWLDARTAALRSCELLDKSKLHKQTANRVLEPFAHITVIATCAEPGLRNFFGLRAHKDAQPEFQVLAYSMLRQWLNSTPAALDWGDWHIPFDPADARSTAYTLEDRLKIATGRIARVSYLTHDGLRDTAKDIELHDRLKQSGHWSPFEHCAQADFDVIEEHRSNFERGWKQYRKSFRLEIQTPDDHDLLGRLADMPHWAREALGL